MSIRDFEELRAWQRARELAVAVNRVVEERGFRRNPGMRDQLQRASASIMSNIAEGFGRFGRREMVRFLGIAQGSCGEVRSLLTLASDLSYLTEQDRASLTDLCRQTSRLIFALRTSLAAKDNTSRALSTEHRARRAAPRGTAFE